MEATPPQEPIRSKPEKPVEPPVPTVRKSKRAATPAPVQAAPVDAQSETVEIDEVASDREATRVYGALALGVMAVLLVCIIAFLIAFRHAPEGL